MIYYRTSNNNDTTAVAMKVVFRKHLLVQAMPKNRKKIIRNSMWNFWLKVEKPF